VPVWPVGDIGYRGVVISSADDQRPDLEPGSLERLAADWLDAEREVAEGIRNPAQAEETARDLSARYDEAIRAASREDLRLAWEAARKNQGEREMGSEAWLEARRLSELLRGEYEAAPRDEIEAQSE
jgi:uncharacterized membrane protein YccC